METLERLKAAGVAASVRLAWHAKRLAEEDYENAALELYEASKELEQALSAHAAFLADKAVLDPEMVRAALGKRLNDKSDPHWHVCSACKCGAGCDDNCQRWTLASDPQVIPRDPEAAKAWREEWGIQPPASAGHQTREEG